MNSPNMPSPWHALSADESVDRLKSDAVNGLTWNAARQRLADHGPNRLAEATPRPVWRKFLDQFKSVLILVLLVAAVLAGAIGDLKDAVVIWSSSSAQRHARLLSGAPGRSRAGGAEEDAGADGAGAARWRSRQIDAAELVPGDIVLLEAGDRVPADGRLLSAHNVEVDEAALTGESQPVAKLR